MEEKVRSLLESTLSDMGIIIDQVIYEKEGNNYFLRIFIDREQAIDIDTCVEVTNVVNPILDQSNLIQGSYILDISSKEKGE